MYILNIIQSGSPMHTDLSFITNEQSRSLKDRFQVLIRYTDFFDCLVGYFYVSGFHAVYPALENTRKIRILIGIGTGKETYDMIQAGSSPEQTRLVLSHAQARQEVDSLVQQEMTDSDDSQSVEHGVRKFIEWIRSGRLEIRAYPSADIHAKLYIMTFKEGDRDMGRVITGSSNFTWSGLVDNLEFNVELKNRSDYEFARDKFERLWQDSVDVSERYVRTIENRTWLNSDIRPYELYLKFLYEYFQDELSQVDEVFVKYLPPEFKKLEYQEQAVLGAKKILLEYGGVFISDVVGLGKTYIAAMLAGQLDGRTLVIAPPVLLDKTNPGSWQNVFTDFRVPADYQSLGKLDSLLKQDLDKYTNVIIDEAHRFRTETTQSFEKLARICRGKRVILVTATPYNNSPGDILSLLKLFQKPRKSTIPNLPDLESFFNRLEKKLSKLDRKKDYSRYIELVRENAGQIRDRVLKYLMIRRTRTEIEKYFSRDIKEQGLKFPEAARPEPLFYQLGPGEEDVFDRTIEIITTKFRYARYMPMLYYTGGRVDQLEVQSQKNMGRFMKILLVKRLESSFFAFKNSVNRFLKSYELFLRELSRGRVYVSAKHISKIFELVESGDDETVQRLIDEGKAEQFKGHEFRPEFRQDLEHDLSLLREIRDMWQNIRRDPKLLRFRHELGTNPVLQNNHLIIFTESKETAGYLHESLSLDHPGKVLLFTGDSGEGVREKVLENFDARARHQKDDHRILVSTEVLSEGVNLHRANVVINYDLPWNPTRMMQRVGRINRIDTPFDLIHTFNFFPTTQSNDQIKLREAAEGKINAFLTLLGGDAELLTEGEPIGSHELFNRLTTTRALEDPEEEASELKYLQVIREIRENDPTLFERIKHLPKKARTAKHHPDHPGSLVTYFRRGKLQKFFMAGTDGQSAELDFISAANVLESGPDDQNPGIGPDIYNLLDLNKQAFVESTTPEMAEPQKKRGRDSASETARILKATLKNTAMFTDDQEMYLRNVLARLEEGALPKQTAKNTLKALTSLGEELLDPMKVLGTLHKNIPERLLMNHFAENSPAVSGRREVILSMYLGGG
jgi:superfamily II DNA or RNA helicase